MKTDIIYGLADVSLYLEDIGKHDFMRTVEVACSEITQLRNKVAKQEERIAIMTKHGLWIPVEELLPEEGKFVLVYGELYPNEKYGGKTAVSRRIDFNYWTGLGRERKVTHWMPLPELPKEGEAE